jgi:hypothetical protein
MRVAMQRSSCVLHHRSAAPHFATQVSTANSGREAVHRFDQVAAGNQPRATMLMYSVAPKIE